MGCIASPGSPFSGEFKFTRSGEWAFPQYVWGVSGAFKGNENCFRLYRARTFAATTFAKTAGNAGKCIEGIPDTSDATGVLSKMRPCFRKPMVRCPGFSKPRPCFGIRPCAFEAGDVVGPPPSGAFGALRRRRRRTPKQPRPSAIAASMVHRCSDGRREAHRPGCVGRLSAKGASGGGGILKPHYSEVYSIAWVPFFG